MCGNETEGAGVPTVDWPACRFCGWAAPTAPADEKCPDCHRWLDGASLDDDEAAAAAIDELAYTTHAGQFGGWTPPTDDKAYTGPRPRVRLTGTDGNAFFVLARVRAALIKAGATREQVQAFISEATAGDYDHLLQACDKYAEIN